MWGKIKYKNINYYNPFFSLLLIYNPHLGFIGNLLLKDSGYDMPESSQSTKAELLHSLSQLSVKRNIF